jgi:hypothetical protein
MLRADFKRHRRQAFTVEHEIERGDQVGRGVDEGAVEVEDNVRERVMGIR